MNRLCILAGLTVLASVATAQSFTTPSGLTFVSNTGITLSSIARSGTISRSANWTLVGATLPANPFDRYSVKIDTRRFIDAELSGPTTATTTTPVSGLQTATTSGTFTSTEFGIGQAGSIFGMSASVTPEGKRTEASTTIDAKRAVLATGSVTTVAAATPGSGFVAPASTSTNWVFDFPGAPASGTATLNLSNAVSSFQRTLDAYGQASGHRDNVRMEVRVFLDGIQVGSTLTSASNTLLAAGNGTTSANSFTFSSIPSVTLGVSDLYARTRALSIETRLVGTAFFGNSTSLGDYTIASSNFSGVNLQGVPEPASIAGLSLGLLAFARRRKSK